MIITAQRPEDIIEQLNEMHPQGWWFKRVTEWGLQVVSGNGMPLDEPDVTYKGAGGTVRWEECTVTSIGKAFRSEYILFAIWHQDRFIGMVHFDGHSANGHIWRISMPGTNLIHVSTEAIDAVCWPKEES